jgi:hypothetical protein
MINLVSRINGLIRHTLRIKQLNHICIVLNLPILQNKNFQRNDSWFAGYFDADGSITYSMKNNSPQLSITITSKYLAEVQLFLNYFKIGKIYYDKARNGYYKWMVFSKSDVLTMLEYFRVCHSHTTKVHRIHLIPRYFELVQIKSYSASTESAQNKAWLNFQKKWNYYF